MPNGVAHTAHYTLRNLVQNRDVGRKQNMYFISIFGFRNEFYNLLLVPENFVRQVFLQQIREAVRRVTSEVAEANHHPVPGTTSIFLNEENELW